MLEAARGPVPSLAAAVAGRPIRGSWWTHPRSREIFAVTRGIRDWPDVAVTALVNGQITYVHRRLWPALVRLAPRLRKSRLARLREVHTRSGAHRIVRQAFPRWLPASERRRASTLTDERAIRLVGAWIVPLLSKP